MLKCIETNRICSKHNKKCKICALDVPERTYSMTDYEFMMKEEIKRKEFEKSIPKECVNCTLLEKDYVHKTVKCLYRSGDNCLLAIK